MEGSKIGISRIMVKLSLAAVVAVGMINGVVSWKLDESISRQAAALSDRMTLHMQKTLSGHMALLRSSMDNLRAEVQRTIVQFSLDPVVAMNLESQHLQTLSQSAKKMCENSGVDILMIFDTDGRLQLSYPYEADAAWAEQYYKSKGLAVGRKPLREAAERINSLDAGSYSAHDSDFLKALGLEQLGEEAMSIESCGIIMDEFGDSLGVCIGWKLLNNYSRILEQLHHATGTAGVLHFGTTPIAQAGFSSGRDLGPTPAQAMKLPVEVSEEIGRSVAPINKTLAFAGTSYISTCSVVGSFDSKQIATFCIGVPEQVVAEMQQAMILSGIETSRNVQSWLIGVCIGSFFLFLLLCSSVSQGITRPISRTIDGLNRTARQVNSASVQLLTVSQALSSGASEQAASLEETSASTRQMAAMTKQNADNARQARHLSDETKETAHRASQCMQQLTHSMEEIFRASVGTLEIVKEIDGIAFQSTLLALNAAVEAAHTGESGAAFSVVADEMKELARRVSDAARTSAGLIEAITRTVQVGTGLLEDSNREFSELARCISKSGQLVEEIAAASSEQAEGIEQINRAIAEMDRITQQNASNAEESATASESMSRDASQMKHFVGDLLSVVGGANHHRNGNSARRSAVALEKLSLVRNPRNGSAHDAEVRYPLKTLRER